MFTLDWQRYDEIMKKNPEDWTNAEQEFFRYMYCVEEHMSGLDGDREGENK